MFESEMRDKIGGAIVMWSIGPDSRRSVLRDQLEAIDLKSFVPEPRTPFAALQAALGATFKHGKDSAKTLVRPLDGERGFAVVNEVRGHESNEYQHASTWLLPATDEHGNALGPVRGVNGADYDHGEAVREHFDFALGTLSASSVGKAMVDLIEHIGGVALRPSGGVYWIAADKIQAWTQIAAAVEAASGEENCKDGRGPSNRAYLMRCLADDQMVRAVGDGIVNEVTTALRDIGQEITDGLGKRAATTRSNKVAQLEAKVERYEAAFGQYLFQIREGLTNTRTELAKATLLDTCDAIRESQENLELVLA